MQRPAPVDLAHHPHLSGLFAPQREEVDVRELEVHGELPADLHGSYLRNGPNPRFDPIGHYVYPIDGDGMVHRVQIAGGTARYTNRFVRTPQVVAEEKAGRALWAGITDPYFPPEEEVGPDLANTMRELPDINIVRHGGRLMAMAEAAPPYTLVPTSRRSDARPSTEPAGRADGAPEDRSAHRRDGRLLLHARPAVSDLVGGRTGRDGDASAHPDRRHGPAVDDPRHGTDATYVVLVLAPLVFDLSQIFSGGSPLDWKPDLGTRVALVPRDGGAVRWFSTDTFWMWHTANAFDLPDGDVALDYVEWAYPGALTEKAGPNRSVLRRAVIGRDGVTRTTLHERDIEFPRIDDRSMTLGHSVVATIGRSRSQKLPAGAADSLFWFDVASGTEAVWAHETLSPGEPAYLSGDSGGYWGAIATDRADMTSWFLVFPETDPASGPIARVRLPIRVPAGLHGAWLPPD